jgi:SPP1 family predicted phage head-tail adaptor
MKAPVFGDTNYTEDFDRKVKEIWAAIKTVTGKVIFDGVSTDISISHEIFIRWDSGITSENGIELSDGRLLDIINVEDFEERQEFLRLMCSIRGDKTLEASHA